MTPFDVEKCLSTMRIIVDTREQPSERAERRYKDFSVPYVRQKLDYGDYSADFLLNDVPIRIKVAIERKMDLDELSSCFTHDRKRFKAEMERAAADNGTMYLLVENATWENLIAGKYHTMFNATAFFHSMTAWIARYGLRPIFCKSETSGKLIQELLYREMKERLERGDYG